MPMFASMLDHSSSARALSTTTSRASELSSPFSSYTSYASSSAHTLSTAMHALSPAPQRKPSQQSLSNSSAVFSDSLQLQPQTSLQSSAPLSLQFPLPPSPLTPTLRLTSHEIKKLKSTWNQMLNDIYDDSSSSSSSTGSADSSDSSDTSPNADADADARASSLRRSKHHASASRAVSSGAASSLFCRQLYMNLVSENPELDDMFPTILHQASAFSGVITIAINSLENLGILDDYLSQIGRRHARVLGIETHHFEMMAAALITTFEDRFGEYFTYELEDLWLRLYQYLANKLLDNYTDEYVMDENDNVFCITTSVPSTAAASSAASLHSAGSVAYRAKPVRRAVGGAGAAATGAAGARPDELAKLAKLGSDAESVYSNDSYSVKQKRSKGSLDTVLTKVLSNQKSSSSNSQTQNPGQDTTAEDFSNLNALKKNKLSKFYNFYKPKTARV